MNDCFRLRRSPTAWSVTLFCSLLAIASQAFSADYPHLAIPASKTSASRRQPRTSSSALFEFEDARQALRLAHRETSRSPQQIEPWFVTMEAAKALDQPGLELQGALAVCGLAKDRDPRQALAGMRMEELGSSAEVVRHKFENLTAIASGNSGCKTAASEALYEAGLEGLAGSDVRSLAERSGWITQWTIARTGSATAKYAPEQFEFGDARIVIPDYLPGTAKYSATADFQAFAAGKYLLQGDLTGVAATVDGQEVPAGIVSLDAGQHHIQVVFRASSTTPRIRLVPYREIDNDSREFGKREAAYLRAAIAMAGATTEAVSDASVLVPRPDSVTYARSLSDAGRHNEAIAELTRITREWPLNRQAHQLLISELQRMGNYAAADRAAAEFLAVAPNARELRRMAQNAATQEDPGAPFYEPYRRLAPEALHDDAQPAAPSVILLQDKVAINRPDGSVSLYMHRVMQIMSVAGAMAYRPLALPDGAQVLTARILNREAQLSNVQAGDEIDEEYVVHYTGDGGMISHPEVFQCVFSDFNSPLLDARFVVLSPATETPGYVISSGPSPGLRVERINGFLAQTWQSKSPAGSAADAAPSIIRVVENENGWSVPPSVERRRILETIHPGPRPREA